VDHLADGCFLDGGQRRQALVEPLGGEAPMSAFLAQWG
jgi:hypothetical protein